MKSRENPFSNKMRVTVPYNQIKFFFILLPFFELAFFSRYTVVHVIFTAAALLSIAYALIYMVGVKRKLRLSAFEVLVFVYESYLIINTVFHNGAVFNSITSAVYTIGLLLVVQMLMERNSYDLVCAMLSIFEIIIYCNFLVMLLFPQGLYNEGVSSRHYWLLGHQNQTILYVIIAIMVSTIYADMRKERFGYSHSMRAICLIACSVVSIVYIWSATAIVGLATILLVVLLNRFGCRLNIWQGIVVSLILFCGVILFRYQALFANLIQNVLHRDISFTGRTAIWDKALYYIKEKPIFGYGVEKSSVANARFGFSTTHCKYLYAFYQGGIVLFGIQLAIFASVAKKNSRDQKNVPIILVACCWALLVQMSLETYTNAIFYLPFLWITEYDRLHVRRDRRISSSRIGGTI